MLSDSFRVSNSESDGAALKTFAARAERGAGSGGSGGGRPPSSGLTAAAGEGLSGWETGELGVEPPARPRLSLA